MIKVLQVIGSLNYGRRVYLVTLQKIADISMNDGLG